MPEANEPVVPDGFSDVFLFKPSDRVRRHYEENGYRVERTDAPGLCRLQHGGATRGGPPAENAELPHVSPSR